MKLWTKEYSRQRRLIRELRAKHTHDPRYGRMARRRLGYTEEELDDLGFKRLGQG
jgi:hypothetical protein